MARPKKIEKEVMKIITDCMTGIVPVVPVEWEAPELIERRLLKLNKNK